MAGSHTVEHSLAQLNVNVRTSVKPANNISNPISLHSDPPYSVSNEQQQNRNLVARTRPNRATDQQVFGGNDSSRDIVDLHSDDYFSQSSISGLQSDGHFQTEADAHPGYSAVRQRLNHSSGHGDSRRRQQPAVLSQSPNLNQNYARMPAHSAVQGNFNAANPDDHRSTRDARIHQPAASDASHACLVPSGMPYHSRNNVSNSASSASRSRGFQTHSAMPRQSERTRTRDNLSTHQSEVASGRSRQREDRSSAVASTSRRTTVNIHNHGNGAAGPGVMIGNNNCMYINAHYSQTPMQPARTRHGPKPRKTITVPDKVVEAHHLELVADNISRDWRRLGRKLGFSDSDLDAINIDNHPLGVREIMYQMLRDWTERRGNEAKVEVLAQALVAIRRPDIAKQWGSVS